MISWLGRGRDARDEADILFAFREWLKAQEGRVGKLSLRPDADSALVDDGTDKAFHFSPGIAAAEPPIDLKRLRTNTRQSVRRRLSRVIVHCLIIFALVGAAVAWLQYADDQTKTAVQAEVTKTWNLASGWVLSVLHIGTGTDVAVVPISENSSQASTQDTAASQAAPVAQPTPQSPQAVAVAQPDSVAPRANPGAQPAQAPVAPRISPELQQKFEALQDDIADVRRIVEQIAIRQERMNQDMVALQTTEQSLMQKLSAPPQTAAAPVAPRTRKTAYPEAAAAPRPIPAPPPRLGTSLTSH